MKSHTDYAIFFRFIDAHVRKGFLLIDRNEELTLLLERTLERNNQFLVIADMIQLMFRFCSSGSYKFLGLNPENVDPAVFFDRTHPEDLKRHVLARNFIFKSSHDLFTEKKGHRLLSTSLRIKNPRGRYSIILFQEYMFYSEFPSATVYLLQVMTDITDNKIIRNGYHHYFGEDISVLRYPDDELLSIGPIFSDREFAILKYIAMGHTSEQIGKMTFNSTHTINTHRRNILRKTGKTSMTELIPYLRDQGLL